jgi:signal transduction histidine kinase/tetratricopeptide (TPR) repeat protein
MFHTPRSTDEEVVGRRYRNTELLKLGNGVETWLGIDLFTGEPVVIKKTSAADVSTNALLRLEHEAEVLRRIASPCLTPLLDVGREGRTVFLVTPFVSGVTLGERLTRGSLPVADTLAVGRALMRALRDAHAHGVLHRDIKPSNVILVGGSPPESVTLLDFGLASSRLLDASLRDQPVGSVAYVSPEQAGLIDLDVGERSDLYSAGILLFECLAGRAPFRGATIGEVLRQHLIVPAPRLRALGLPVPRALDEVIQRLLCKDPRDRYQSADAVLDDLDEIVHGLASGIADPELVVGGRDQRRGLTEPAFVGRQRELAVVEREIDQVFDGHAHLVLLEGESGAGKSRLLDEIALRSAQRGAWVLRGESAGRAAQRPLQVLDGVVHQILFATRSDPELAAHLRVRVGEQAEAVCAALPQLYGVLAPGCQLSLAEEAHGEARSLPALITLLDALGSGARPVVILLDDCQWSDDLSLRLLAHWHAAHEAAPGPERTLVVAAFRSDEIAADYPLRRIEHAPRIALAPLDARQVGQMIESMAGVVPDEAVALVASLSEGNPFIVAAVLEGLVEGGALVNGPKGWEIEPQAMADAHSSRRAAAFLAQRLDRLPPRTLGLLSVGAVLGKPFELRFAARLAGQSETEAMEGAAEARHRHFVWLDGRGSRCAFVHERLREVLLERLPVDERRRLHRLAAVELARGDDVDNAFEVAYHFDAAGDSVRALPHALRAASQARARHALEIAERQYLIAARGLDAADPETRVQVAEGLGDVLLLRGHYDAAGAQLARASELARQPAERARIEGKLGELAFKRGDTPAASEALERALELLGRRVPRRFLAVLIATLWQALVQIAHTLLPRALIARRPLESSGPDLLAARIFSRLAYANWFLRGQVATFWAHLSELNLAERYPPTRELAQAYSEHALSVTGLPRFMFPRGERYAERGLAIRRGLSDLWGQGQSLSFYGLLLYAEGRYPEALDKLREANRLLRRTGDRWEENIAGFHIALCLYRLGEVRGAVDEARQVHRQAVAIGDGHAAGFVLEAWAKASGGAVPRELIEEAFVRSEGDAQIREVVLQAEGVRLLSAGRPDEAAAAFAQGEAVARAANLRSEYVSYLPLWLGQALRLAVVRKTAPLGVTPRAEQRAAERAIRRAMPLARRYRGNLSMALRERALLRAMRGRLRQARRDLDESLAVADELHQRLEYAQTLLARGELGALDGWPGADEDAARARATLTALGTARAGEEEGARAATLSLADRFGTITREGRRIASALAVDEVYDATCEAAATLLRAETTILVAVEDGEVRPLSRRGAASDVCRSLVWRAVEQRRTLLLDELPVEGLGESVVLAGLRSALCAPIVAGGQVVACLYAAHRTVGALFSDSEKRLAAYIVTLAGASLDKARAFAQVEALTRSLERRVEERSAELRAANTELDANLQRLRQAQEQLVHTAKMAAIGTLVAGLSHEINNPIAVILGQAQSRLRTMPTDHPFRSGLEAIERQAHRCANLVRRLLDFSHRDSTGGEVTAIDPFLRGVLELARPQAFRAGIELTLRPAPPGMPAVTICRTEIESTLLNLVDNAISASARGATVEVGAGACERDGLPGVTIHVRDRGAGIPAELLPRIFDPFFTTKPAGAGTGLGLSLARQFAERNGGALAAESQPGEGTTVRLWLPATGAAPSGDGG